MHKITLFFLVSFINFSGLNAQVAPDKPEIENDFTHLVSTNEVVYQLQKNYGISGSVLLSKTLLQILNSYSSQQQAQNTWQTAINKITENQTNSSIAIVDSNYTYGQLLSQYSQGMSQQIWHKKRAPLSITKKNLSKFFITYDDLTIYFNLHRVWELLLKDIGKQENIQWHLVFDKSLNLFSEEDDVIKVVEKLGVDEFFKALDKLQGSDAVESQLPDLMQLVGSVKALSPLFYQNIIRFSLEKKNLNYLSASMSWLSVAQYLYLYDTELTDESRFEVIKFIEENDTWFLSNEESLLAINIGLPAWLEKSFHNLKQFYIHSHESHDFNLVTLYEMLDTRLNNYLTSHLRQDIRTNLEICLNISEEFSPFPQEPIDKNQFEGCVDDFKNWATQLAISDKFASSLTKIESQDAEIRTLELPIWQTINLIYANMAKKDCLKESQTLINPLEWAIAAESLLWFADRWPAYFNEYPQNSAINTILQEGQKLTQELNCLVKSKSETLDSYFSQIVQEWQNVKAQIKSVSVEFNNNNLAPDSDIDLTKNADKTSNYKVQDMMIQACDVKNSCGVHLELEATRSIFGLFPNHLLVANQLKLGNLKICYDDIGWENRHTVSTHLDNDSVSNYLGQFTFSLKGFYNEELVFNKKLIDNEEYLYLFAANTDEVLNTSCPLEIIGTKISTKLARGMFGLVPNRLTFLTASRADESSILNGNWNKGAEWNDAITDENLNFKELNEHLDTKSSIQQAYQLKADQLQTTIYRTILGINTDVTPAQQQLADSFASMQRALKFFKAYNYILQMNNLMVNDDLHGLFYGNNKIPDKESISELFNNQLNINLLIENIDNNLKSNQEKWNALEKMWSNQHILDILFRLKSLIE